MSHNSILLLKQGMYTIDKENPAMCLGRGSFGKVYKAHDNHKNIWVAVKQVNLELMEMYEDQMKEVILNEINVMKKFTKKMNQTPCENLVKQYDCFRSDKFIYIVMEYCPHGTLFDQLKSKLSYTQQQAIQIARQLLNDLVYLQNMNIAHRDFKPENIFITEDYNSNGTLRTVYKIGDFGFSSQKKTFNDVLGTYQYMAPEIFNREEYTSKVDVWSFGITIHQLLFNELYYSGKNKWEIEEKIKSTEYVLNEQQKSKISKQMNQFLKLCLTKNKFQRPSASQLTKNPLFGQKIQQCPHTFSMLRFSIQRCNNLAQLSQQFQSFEEWSNRKTIFIQLYFLKLSYCQMNKIAYSLMNRSNYIGIEEERFQQLLDERWNQQFQGLNQLSQQVWRKCSEKFNEKYQRFVQQYLPRFSENQRQMIKKVVNDQPYEEIVPQIFSKQLKKWVTEFDKYIDFPQEFEQLKKQCASIVNSFQLQ